MLLMSLLSLSMPFTGRAADAEKPPAARIPLSPTLSMVSDSLYSLPTQYLKKRDVNDDRLGKPIVESESESIKRFMTPEQFIARHVNKERPNMELVEKLRRRLRNEALRTLWYGIEELHPISRKSRGAYSQSHEFGDLESLLKSLRNPHYYGFDLSKNKLYQYAQWIIDTEKTSSDGTGRTDDQALTRKFQEISKSLLC
jgi:hypothetical protein